MSPAIPPLDAPEAKEIVPESPLLVVPLLN
jgi:hypothetical protein